METDDSSAWEVIFRSIPQAKGLYIIYYISYEDIYCFLITKKFLSLVFTQPSFFAQALPSHSYSAYI